MPNFMPLVHQSRRLRALWSAHNPFVTRRELGELLTELEAGYSTSLSTAVSRQLRVEIDLVGDLVCAATSEG